ncbi:MAG: NHLP-related RiPP peptide [Rhodanobacteraceae bacterium]|nr:NHLP-related RiPP peptide [Rhodanobacteraceae bacterium]
MLDKAGSTDEFRSATAAPATVRLASAQVDMLLDKLSSDDAFRALLLSDPAAALGQIGAPIELVKCFGKCKQLADAETLKASRAAIRQQIGATLSANIHDLRVS